MEGGNILMAESLQNALLSVELQDIQVAGCAFQSLDGHSLPVVKRVGVNHAVLPCAYALGGGFERAEPSKTPLHVLKAPAAPRGGHLLSLHAPWRDLPTDTYFIIVALFAHAGLYN